MNVAKQIVEAIDATFLEGSMAFPCKTNRCSSLGGWIPEFGGCLRQGFYERTRWQEKQLPELGLLRIFEEGNVQEAAVLKRLAEAGYPIIRQQVMVEYAKYNITGSIDGAIRIEGNVIPVEIKSMSPHVFDKVFTLKDFNKFSWTKKYLVQIMLYLFLNETEFGLFILKNKSTGEIKVIEVSLDYDLVELALQTAEKMETFVANGTEPDMCDDREVCKKCSYSHICLPAIDFNAPLKLVDDPMMLESLERWFLLRESGAEFSKLDEKIKSSAKAQFKADNGCNILIGDFRVISEETGRGITTTIEKVGV